MRGYIAFFQCCSLDVSSEYADGPIVIYYNRRCQPGVGLYASHVEAFEMICTNVGLQHLTNCRCLSSPYISLHLQQRVIHRKLIQNVFQNRILFLHNQFTFQSSLNGTAAQIINSPRLLLQSPQAFSNPICDQSARFGHM